MPSLVTLVDGTIPVAADFNGNYQALNNAIGSGTTISAYTTGDTLYASATNTLSKLAKGTVGQVLTQGVSTPSWANPGAFDQLTGLGLANNGSDPTNDIDVAVGAAASDDAVISDRIYMSLTSGLTKQLDSAWVVGTNQGMRDTGSIADGTWHIFEIMRPDTGVVDILASLSATTPTMPTNYTKKRRIGSIIRASGAILLFIQDGDHFRLKSPVKDVNAQSQTNATWTTRTLASVPVGLRFLAFGLCRGNAGTGSVALRPTDASDGNPDTSSGGNLGDVGDADAGSVPSGPFEVLTDTSAQIQTNVSGGTQNITIITRGWTDRRGKG